MKNMKKVMCLLLALVLVLGMSITVFADGGTTTSNTYTISVPGTDTHTYAVYQIFTGDWSAGADGKDVFSNIKWGANAKLPSGAEAGGKVADAILTELQAKTTDKDVLEYLEQYVNLASKAVGTVSKDKSLSVPAGYYLIKDENTISGDDAATLYIVQVVRATEIKRKADKPKVEKKVKENSTGAWGDYADYNVGDDVSFRLVGTLPSNYDIYDTYKYVFHDTLSAGLTYNGDAKVYAIKGEVTEDKIIESNLINPAPTVNSNGTTLDITFDNLKDSVAEYDADIKIVVRYTAKLNDGAVIGSTGNPNSVKLEFSNNPNNSGAGNTDTGETPEDKVVVFTFELDGTKVDGGNNGTTLAGAEFRLYRLVGDGDPKTREYVQITNGKVSGWTGNEANASTLTTGTNGLFTFSGLDAGTYYLEETKAPTGYNLLEGPLEIVITAEYSVDESTGEVSLKSLSAMIGEGSATGTPSNGQIAFNVENNKGSNLPVTGGIGTKIFYVLGGILVVCCGLILFAKKLVSRNN